MQTLPAVDTRWPHHVAVTVVTWMRVFNNEAERMACLRVLETGPGVTHAPATRPRPDALGELIEAGLVAVGDQLEWAGHTATVRPGGALARGTEPHGLGISAVSALATSLATPATVNGWHLWRRARDNRTLAALREELASTSHVN